MAILTLHPGKEKSLLRRHPWIFEGAVAHLKAAPAPATRWTSSPHDGRPLGRAAFSPHSQIRARLWSFDAEETIDHAFFKRRVAAAVAARRGAARAAPGSRACA
jgi:23S rRNA (cytosine1962-C5)-methyltransferase